MRISDWSSDVCSSDLEGGGALALFQAARMGGEPAEPCPPFRVAATRCGGGAAGAADGRGVGGAAGAARLCGCGGGDFQIGRAAWRDRVCPYEKFHDVDSSLLNETTD